ncbi:MAG: hypothetical protein P8Y71_01855 [Pseudolabrys sp.]|jgi:hypothetical protein
MSIEIKSMTVVVHIGANKSGSTTLQRKLFARHPSIHYVGEDASDYQDYRTLLFQFLSADDIFWNREQFEKFIVEQLDKAAGKTFVFSSEDIMTSAVASLCAQRLRALLGDAKILLIIRNQFTALESFYASHGAYLRDAPSPYFRRYVPLENWLSYHSSVTEHGPVASFDYVRFVDYFESLFGTGSVNILLFEDMVEERERFRQQLSQVLCIPEDVIARHLDHAHERKRDTVRFHNYRKFRSFLGGRLPFNGPRGQDYLSRALSQFLYSGPPVQIVLPDYWKRHLTARYAAGNARLASAYGLPLQDYGYPL